MSGDINFQGTQEEWDALVKRNREAQKKLITEVMEANAKDGLYKQQTAVEWIVDQMVSEGHKEMWKDMIAQAKAMEKKQHGNTWDEAIDTHERRGHNIARSIVDFDDYYNETYNKQS